MFKFLRRRKKIIYPICCICGEKIKDESMKGRKGLCYHYVCYRRHGIKYKRS